MVQLGGIFVIGLCHELTWTYITLFYFTDTCMLFPLDTVE